jgi:hypothetical protein
MSAALCALALTAVLAADPPDKSDTPRKPNPFAPSLPELTKEEEDKLDDLIDRVLKADTGQIKGDDAKAAFRDFDKLGPEAIPALIRGLNKAAKINHSCPTLVITKKLAPMLMASKDTELLEFARDNIGAGVEKSGHTRVLEDLRFKCLMRKNALLRAADVAKTDPKAEPKTPRTMTVTELVDAISTERGSRLKQALTELEQRKGSEVLAGLALGTANSDKEIQQLSRDLLDKHIGRQKPDVVKEKLKDDQAEVRKSAARVVATKFPSLGGDLIELLADEDAEVRQTAHQSLVKLNKGDDLGPADDATKEQREASQQKWREWWKKQKK